MVRKDFNILDFSTFVFILFSQVSCKVVFFLFVSSVTPAPDSCCKVKKVGDILYELVESDNQAATSVYGCKNGCVYKTEGLPDKICFTTGPLPVLCKSQGGGGGWCYDGVCGVDQWPLLYQVQ